MARSRFEWDARQLQTRTGGYTPHINKALYAATELHASKAEADMRANAPWQDQTGNARSGLRGEAFHEPNRHGFDLFHSVPYGIWLEVRWSGKYAIIGPTLKRHGVEVMRTFAALMSRGG